MVKPGGKHGGITFRLGLILGQFVIDNDLGEMTAAETGFITKRRDDGRDRVHGLDIAFINKSKLPNGLPDGHIAVAPDLAVEVISPGNSAEDIHEKVLELQDMGTELIWLVYLKTKTITVHTPDSAKIYQVGDTLNGGDVLPNFSLPVDDIFPE